MSKTFNKNIPYTFSGAINLSTSAGLNITNNSNTIGSIITTGGNVGIGTTSPTGPLTIASGSNIISNTIDGANFFRTSITAGHPSVSLVYNYQSGKNVYWGEDSDTGLYIFRGRQVQINGGFEASNSNGLMLFASSGNIGIVTTSPSALLDIAGGSDSSGAQGSPLISLQYRISSGGGFRHFIKSRHNAVSSLNAGNAIDFYLNTSNTASGSSVPGTGNALGMTIAANGVSIRTTTPISALTVNNIVYDRNVFDHSVSPLTVTQNASSGTSVLNDQIPVMHLCRQGFNAQTYGQRATFALSRYENSSTNSRTRLDIQLAQNAYDTQHVMSIRGDGYVGINTTSPSSPLDVINNSNGQFPVISRFLAPNTTGGSSQSPRIVVGVDATDSISMSYYKEGTTSANNYIGWGHNNVADGQMVLTRNGNVGIGTVTPLTRFHVNLPSGVGNGNVYFGATAGYPPFGADCNVNNGVVGFLFNSSSSSPKGLNIYYDGVSNGGGSSYFICNDNNSLRFQVLGNGNVQNANNSYGATSDIKIKENIVDATPKIDDLMKVKIRNFNRIGESTKQIGVIAQELETVFPGLVEETEDVDKDNKYLGTTTKAVKYSVFIPILIKAIQELKIENDALKTFINQKFPDANL